MTTSKPLYLMLAMTILFGFSTMFSILQLSKIIQFQHLNFLYLKNITELSETIKEHKEIPLLTSNVIEKLETIRKQATECSAMMNSLDRYIMTLIKTDTAISLCEKDVAMLSDLIEDIYRHKAPMIIDPVLIDAIAFSIEVFRQDSRQLDAPIDKTGRFTIQLVTILIIPFSIFVILVAIYLSRKIHKKTSSLHDAIAELEISKEEKKRLAYYDTLTSLPNRNLFTELLEHEIHQVTRYNKSFALLYIDLDRFKFINDTLGHGAGDDLIVQVSQRLSKCTRESDTLARFGGDEFLLILSGPNSEKHATIVSEKIIKTISDPFMLDDHEMHISASIGIAYCPKNALDSTTLMKRADIAMYEAKTNGKNQYHTYEEHSINHKTEHRLTLEKDLRRAIQNDELQLYYQPVINLSNYNTVGVEALLRWKHNSKGMVPPFEFIPIAEETGMIQEVGDWVINQACKQCKIWRESGRPGFHVAVNVSSIQLKNNKLATYISDILNFYSLPATALDIEITENVFYGEDKNSLNTLEELSEMGIRLLLDDFGTGYSSLSTLHGMPFDTIKIDRSFMDIEHSKKRVMAQTIVDMAKNFGMQTIAEGAEDQETVDYLRQLGCDFVQGYYFQRPIAAEELDITKNYKQAIVTSNVTSINSKR